MLKFVKRPSGVHNFLCANVRLIVSTTADIRQHFNRQINIHNTQTGGILMRFRCSNNLLLLLRCYERSKMSPFLFSLTNGKSFILPRIENLTFFTTLHNLKRKKKSLYTIRTTVNPPDPSKAQLHLTLHWSVSSFLSSSGGIRTIWASAWTKISQQWNLLSLVQALAKWVCKHPRINRGCGLSDFESVKSLMWSVPVNNYTIASKWRLSSLKKNMCVKQKALFSNLCKIHKEARATKSFTYRNCRSSEASTLFLRSN